MAMNKSGSQRSPCSIEAVGRDSCGLRDKLGVEWGY